MNTGIGGKWRGRKQNNKINTFIPQSDSYSGHNKRINIYEELQQTICWQTNLPLYGGNKMQDAWDWKLLANCQHLKAGIDHYIRSKLWVKNYTTQLLYSKHWMKTSYFYWSRSIISSQLYWFIEHILGSIPAAFISSNANDFYTAILPSPGSCSTANTPYWFLSAGDLLTNMIKST